MSTVLSEFDNGVQTITLNRPERRNAINDQLMTDLLAALDKANNDKQVRVIVLAGAGKSFCAGDDLEHTEKTLAHLDIASRTELELFAHDLQSVTERLLFGNKFVIAAVQGHAVGAGFEWVLNCDFSIWAEETVAFFPEMQWGLFPTCGITGLLPRMVGAVKAREMLLLGEHYSAQQLLDCGVAWKLVPLQDLADEAQRAARKIAALPDYAVVRLKKVMNRALSENLNWALQAEEQALVEVLLEPETRTLLQGFTAK